MLARNDYERFLEQKWAGIAVPTTVLERAVRRATDSGIARIERWVRSYNNEVYSVDTESGDQVVIRIARRGHDHFGQEAWALRRCRDVGVPVPEVLEVFHERTDDGLLSICVQTRLAGESLDLVLDELDPSSVRGI